MLVFVDVEASGGSPVTGIMTEFGAVVWPKAARGWLTYHGVFRQARPSKDNPAVPEVIHNQDSWSPWYEINENKNPIHVTSESLVITEFDHWLGSHGRERPVFVSDNVAFDWQWINCEFWRYLGRNPFGHSGRRISDFYAGLTGDFRNTQKWKRLRVTPHTHNPVDDAKGNAEAFSRIMKGER